LLREPFIVYMPDFMPRNDSAMPHEKAVTYWCSCSCLAMTVQCLLLLNFTITCIEPF